MKKMLAVFCVLTALLLSACSESISDSGIIATDPPQHAPAILPHVRSTDENGNDLSSPDPSAPPATDTPVPPATPSEPADESILPPSDSISDPAKMTQITKQISGYPHNETSAPDGTVKDMVQKDGMIVYTIKYAETFSMIVEIEQQKSTAGTAVTVRAYLQHYALSMVAGKPISVSIGSCVQNTTSPEIDWKEDTAAKSLLVSATHTTTERDAAKISINMPYGGEYRGAFIETLSFAETIALK